MLTSVDLSAAQTKLRGQRLQASSLDMSMVYKRLRMLREAGDLKRMHTISTQRDHRIGQHVYGAMCIAVELCRINLMDPGPVLLTLLYHDAPERSTGDIPAPTKRASPAISNALELMENQFFDEYGLLEPYDILRMQNIPHPGIMEIEEAIVKAADVLDLMQMCIHERMLGNRNQTLEWCYTNCDGYLATLEWVPGVENIRFLMSNEWSHYRD